MKLKTLHFWDYIEQKAHKKAIKNIYLLYCSAKVRLVAETKINEFDRGGSINIKLGVNVMAMRAPAVFHYVQKSK